MDGAPAVELAEDTAARFLPLVAHESPHEYDLWALRWRGRWMSEGAPTIEQTAEVAGLLADLASEPEALAAVRAVA